MLNLVCHQMLKLNLICRRLPVSRQPRGLIQTPMPGLTFMQGVLGLNRVPHSLTYGCITQMGNLMRTSPLSKYIASMKTRRNVCTQAKLWRWNKPRARAAGVHHYRWHECQVYHKRLAELLSAKKGEDYSTTMSWIRTRISFAILRTSLLC